MSDFTDDNKKTAQKEKVEKNERLKEEKERRDLTDIFECRKPSPKPKEQPQK